MAKLVSWLERAVENFPQARATAGQWLANLRKNPEVSSQEMLDRGLEDYFSGTQGPVSREDLLGYLRNDDPLENVLAPPDGPYRGFQNWATPGLEGYAETVYANPAWDTRALSEHFEGLPGYQFHTRGGYLETPDMGRGLLMDEVQSDVASRMTRGAFDPNGRDPRPLDYLADPGDARTFSALNDARRRTRRDYPGYLDDEFNLIYLPGEYNDNFNDAMRELDMLQDEWKDSGQLVDVEYALDNLRGFNEAVHAASSDLNLPGRKSWPWHGTARSLQRALGDNAEFFGWPTAETQYARYYDKAPQDYPETSFMRQNATNTGRMFQKLYDKELGGNRRWRQLGLEPTRQDIGGRSYWTVKLTPDIRKRLNESGIPYYAVGGAAVLGGVDDEEDL